MILEAEKMDSAANVAPAEAKSLNWGNPSLTSKQVMMLRVDLAYALVISSFNVSGLQNPCAWSHQKICKNLAS
jgi:hypothetical protein